MIADVLWEIVQNHADSQARIWLRDRKPMPGKSLSSLAFRAAFAGAGRRLRSTHPTLSEKEETDLRREGIIAPPLWRLDECARAALLISALQASYPGLHVPLVCETYSKGDENEQAVILRSLALLPEPGRFLETAIDGCRTNVRDVFEAISCENSYPAEYFPDPSFNHLVLKAYFLGLQVSRIVLLAKRKNAELRRMVADYTSERRAAGRSLPVDIDLVLS
jgi:hypothetical protein